MHKPGHKSGRKISGVRHATQGRASRVKGIQMSKQIIMESKKTGILLVLNLKHEADKKAMTEEAYLEMIIKNNPGFTVKVV